MEHPRPPFVFFGFGSPLKKGEVVFEEEDPEDEDLRGIDPKMFVFFAVTGRGGVSWEGIILLAVFDVEAELTLDEEDIDSDLIGFLNEEEDVMMFERECLWRGNIFLVPMDVDDLDRWTLGGLSSDSASMSMSLSKDSSLKLLSISSLREWLEPITREVEGDVVAAEVDRFELPRKFRIPEERLRTMFGFDDIFVEGERE